MILEAEDPTERVILEAVVTKAEELAHERMKYLARQISNYVVKAVFG